MEGKEVGTLVVGAGIGIMVGRGVTVGLEEGGKDGICVNVGNIDGTMVGVEVGRGVG